VITWAASDGREQGGDRVVPAASASTRSTQRSRLGAERTHVRRPMISDGPENLTCARDLARGLAAIEEERVLEALALAQHSELHFRLEGREVLVKTGELWPAVYHEVALVDRSLAVAVCSAPAALPHEVAARAESVFRDSLDRGHPA
jgi:hypothetical protein